MHGQMYSQWHTVYSTVHCTVHRPGKLLAFCPDIELSSEPGAGWGEESQDRDQATQARHRGLLCLSPVTRQCRRSALCKH